MKKFDMNHYYLNTEDYAKYMKSDFENIEKLVQETGIG